jgi:hypothetical protein
MEAKHILRWPPAKRREYLAAVQGRRAELEAEIGRQLESARSTETAKP